VSNLQAISLKEAQICLSCDVISNAKKNCPACGEQSLWCLASWIKQNGNAEAA
jgi:predicted RNA-binding Zn-ribbon protein involved in translation (DUF1610 family)